MTEPGDLHDPATLTATFCATVVDEWVRAGVGHAVVAPGSRSTPMALALAGRPELRVHVHHDERAAAFLALGIGLSTGVPAVVLTTSGTAAVELHPAVVEAHQAGIPMVVVTADRPPELWDVGAPQTVDQTHLFGRSARWFSEPGPPAASAAASWRSFAARSVLEATGHPAGPGPVHLNLSFREPLVGTPTTLPDGRPDGAPWHRSLPTRPGDTAVLPLEAVERGVIIAGRGSGDPAAVLTLAERTGWPVLADPRSGVRGDHPAVIAHADSLLRDAGTAESLRPDLVIRVGEPPASKGLAHWLSTSDARQVSITADARWYDPDRTAGEVVRGGVDAVLPTLCTAGTVGDGDASPSQTTPSEGTWIAAWRQAERAAARAIDDTLTGLDAATEPAVARTLGRVLPPDSTLVVSSSMPIRDVEWFGGPVKARVLANRGANGIDGVVSTAVGVALTGVRTAVLVGDVAFLHDSNALLGLAKRGVNLTIVVIDNDGGGIFSFLPQASALPSDRFEQLFGTPHGVDLAVLASAHGIDVRSVSTPAGVTAAIGDGMRRGGVGIVRVVTDRAANVELHRRLDAAVVAALRGE